MNDILTHFAKDDDKVTTVELGSGDTTGAVKVDTVGDHTNSLVSNIQAIINGVIAVLGIVAVVVIIMGGISYMTSSGDAAKVKKAKDTILYGVIGLIICVLAFAIVNFVIFNLIGNGSATE